MLGKIRGFELSSWTISLATILGRPMAWDFFAAFGHDGLGQIGSETTINSGDLAGILMDAAVQALEKRTAELKHKEAQIAVLESQARSAGVANQIYPDNSRESFGDAVEDHNEQRRIGDLSRWKNFSFSLAQTDALAKFMIEKVVITREEFV